MSELFYKIKEIDPRIELDDFKNRYKIKCDLYEEYGVDIEKKESIKSIDRGKENNEDNNNKAPGPEINLNQLRKKYFRDFVGYMKHYPKKMENNIKRANSKDSETSDDRSPETIKRRKRNEEISKQYAGCCLANTCVM